MAMLQVREGAQQSLEPCWCCGRLVETKSVIRKTSTSGQIKRQEYRVPKCPDCYAVFGQTSQISMKDLPAWKLVRRASERT